MQREPTHEELSSLLQNWLDEEMLFREALRLGMDADDVIVRRRLVQKVTFIAEESVPPNPSDTELRRFFGENADRYELPSRYTFSQYRFDDEKTAKTVLAAGGPDNAEVAGRTGMLNRVHIEKSPRDIVSSFGGQFAVQLTALTPGENWQGPLISDFGWHVVQLRAVLPPGPPAFETVRGNVLNDYLYHARERARGKFLEGLRDHYDVKWQLDEP